MAEAWPDRDHAAFARFIADEALFFSGPTPLRGRQPVIDFWARFYAGPKAPFSWEPDEVEVLDGGTLALSSGPVRNPDGKLVARFTSVWRRTPAGRWEIVFDKGSEVCDCAPQAGVPPRCGHERGRLAPTLALHRRIAAASEHVDGVLTDAPVVASSMRHQHRQRHRSQHGARGAAEH